MTGIAALYLVFIVVNELFLLIQKPKFVIILLIVIMFAEHTAHYIDIKCFI